MCTIYTYNETILPHKLGFVIINSDIESNTSDDSILKPKRSEP